jgi:hypothetical protein
VRHPHHRIQRIGQRQPAGDLLGRPPQGQLGLHRCPQPRLGHQLGRLGPPGTTEGRSVSGLGPVAVAATVAGQLPRHRRWGSAQPGRDLSTRLPDGHTTADLFAFGHAQAPRPTTGRLLLHSAGLEHEGAHRRSPFAQPAGDQPQRLTLPPPRPDLVLFCWGLTVPRTAPTTSTADNPSVRRRCNHPWRPRAFLRQGAAPHCHGVYTCPEPVSEINVAQLSLSQRSATVVGMAPNRAKYGEGARSERRPGAVTC